LYIRASNAIFVPNNALKKIQANEKVEDCGNANGTKYSDKDCLSKVFDLRNLASKYQDHGEALK